MRLSTKIVLGTALIIIIAITAGAFYFFAETKNTPEHSLGLLNNAIKQHDLATFEKHMDTETFYAQAFDDVIAPTLHQSSNPEGINDFLAGIMSSVKQTFVSSMTETTKRYVETGSLDNQSNIPEQNLAKKFTELTDFRNITFKTTGNATIEGNIAYVNIALTQVQLGQDFNVQVKMRKLDDNTWRLVGITNIRTFLGELSKAKEAKLAELNKPIAADIETKIKITSNKFEHQKNSRFGESYNFLYSPELNFISEKQIAEFVGEIDVFDKNKDKIFTQKFVVPGPFPLKTKQEYKFSWPLNPFVPSDKVLITTADSDLTVKSKIIRVKFTDGSEIKLLENLSFNKTKE